MKTARWGVLPVMAYVAAVAALGIAVTASAQQTARTTNDAVFSTEQAERGAELYQQVCVTCHGPALGGDDMVPPLAGAKFTASWNGTTVANLYDRIRLGMPADMPATLDRQQAVDAVAFILKSNGAPSGQAELPPDSVALKNIKITTPK